MSHPGRHETTNDDVDRAGSSIATIKALNQPTVSTSVRSLASARRVDCRREPHSGYLGDREEDGSPETDGHPARADHHSVTPSLEEPVNVSRPQPRTHRSAVSCSTELSGHVLKLDSCRFRFSLVAKQFHLPRLHRQSRCE